MKNSDPGRNRKIYDEMLTNSIAPVFRERTDADRAVEMSEEHIRLLRQNAIGFAEPTTAVEKTFKKIAPGLWEYWAAWKELQ